MEIKLHRSALSIEFINNDTSNKVHLTRSEFLIFHELFEAKGAHLTKKMLKISGWPDSYVCDNSLTVSIMSLRKKLREYNNVIKIKTIQRVGYSLYLVTDEFNS